MVDRGLAVDAGCTTRGDVGSRSLAPVGRKTSRRIERPRHKSRSKYGFSFSVDTSLKL